MNLELFLRVMALTQTQLDEALKPAWCDSHGVSLGGQTSVSEHLTSPFILTKIQSVTSPKVLPPSSCVISDVIVTPGSFWSDLQMFHNFSQAESDSSMLFGKDKLPKESCYHLEDCEAAASAVATATPFISPSGGITGVQACQHMVVYNHNARLGQFEQVRLIFVGAMCGILTMASPLAMFDVSPFQIHLVDSRVCAPIEGTSPACLADCVALNSSKFQSKSTEAISPLCALDDEERGEEYSKEKMEEREEGAEEEEEKQVEGGNIGGGEEQNKGKTEEKDEGADEEEEEEEEEEEDEEEEEEEEEGEDEEEEEEEEEEVNLLDDLKNFFFEGISDDEKLNKHNQLIKRLRLELEILPKEYPYARKLLCLAIEEGQCEVHELFGTDLVVQEVEEKVHLLEDLRRQLHGSDADKLSEYNKFHEKLRLELGILPKEFPCARKMICLHIRKAREEAGLLFRVDLLTALVKGLEESKKKLGK